MAHGGRKPGRDRVVRAGDLGAASLVSDVETAMLQALADAIASAFVSLKADPALRRRVMQWLAADTALKYAETKHKLALAASARRRSR